MVTQFHSYIAKRLSFIQHKKLLVAVSGGLDSMVLYHLCRQNDMDIAVAHCNFGLRAEESDAETTFVKTTMEQAGVPFYSKHFDTYAYAKERKISTQMAARDLRYDWFQELARTHHFDYILTAHHANDTAETFLINASRGTGWKGLAGIPVQNGNVVRPLLGFWRKQLKEYATAHQLRWKEDSSNASDQYVRNHIRHHAIPALEEANPFFIEGVLKTQEYLKQSIVLLDAYKKQLKQEFTYPINSIQGPSGFCIDLKKLATHSEPDAVLYALLDGYGFTSWQDIYALKSAQSGKKVSAGNHTLLKDRDTLQLLPVVRQEAPQVYWIEDNEASVKVGGLVLQQEEAAQWEVSEKNEIFVDKNRLTFPLHIRSWQEGDYFFPLGMGGKKKLSKFFKDEKLSLNQKQEVKILCSENEIVWVLGMRPDDRFKVSPTTQTILKISYHTYEV